MPIPLIAVLGAAGLGGYLLLRNRPVFSATRTFPTPSNSGLVLAPQGVTSTPAQAASAASQDIADQAAVDVAFNDLEASSGFSAGDQSSDFSQPLPQSALQTTPRVPGESTTTRFVDPGSGLRVDPSHAPPPMSVEEPDTLANVIAAATDPFGLFD